MSGSTAKLLSEFEALGIEEKHDFVRQLIQHLPPWDSGPLSDEVVAAAGDQLAAMIEGEEEEGGCHISRHRTTRRSTRTRSRSSRPAKTASGT